MDGRTISITMAKEKEKSGTTYEVSEIVKKQGYKAKIGGESIVIDKGQEEIEVTSDKAFYELGTAGVIVIPEGEYERYKKLIGAKL